MDLEQIIVAVQGSGDPAVSQEMRIKYVQVIQDYKEKLFALEHLESFLYNRSNVYLPLFGLQCCEYAVIKQWHTFTIQQKQIFRDGMLQILNEFNFASVSTEETRVFNSQMGRVFVEILKREWPVYAPNFLHILLGKASISNGAKSVVLGVLLRLSEDLIENGGDGLPAKRKSEIMSGLQKNMDKIFDLLVETVQNYETTHLQSEQSQLTKEVSDGELIVCRMALETLMAYVGWVGLEYSCQGGGVFLEVICRFLSLPAIRTQAAEILLVLMRRKGAIEDKSELKIVWENPRIFDILEASVSALDIQHPEDGAAYSYTVRLCQLLATTGIVALQLRECITAWIKSELPPNFERLVQVILRLTAHPAKPISYEAYLFWTAYLKELPEEAYLSLFERCVLPTFLELAKSALMKTGLPTEDSLESKFSRNEFSFDDDFLFFFGRYRCTVIECIRIVCQHFPDYSFRFFLEWAKSMITAKFTDEELDANGNCTARSPNLLRWEALSLFGDGAINALLSAKTQSEGAEISKISQRYPDGPVLLSTLLENCSRDPLLLTSQVSLLVALLPFAEDLPDLVTAVLQKLVTTMTFELPGQNRINRVKSVRNLRRHVGACMIRIARDQPQLVLPVFDALYETVNQLCTSDNISALEKCNLIEALLLLSQRLEDTQKGRTIIQAIMEPVKMTWCSHEMSHVLGDLSDFMHFVGLSLPISEHETGGNNRCKIMTCIMSFYSILKRVPGAGFNESFLAGLIMPVLPNLFRFLRTLNGLTSPEGVALRHSDYKAAFELTEHQKYALLGIPHPSSVQDSYNSPDTKDPCERMKTFLHGLYEHVLFVLGLSINELPGSLFVPLLYDTVYTFVLAHLDHLPDLKLTTILRLFIKPIFTTCPLDASETVLVPLISLMCPLLQRLLTRWHAIQQSDRETDDGDDIANQEVIEEQLLRNLTRQYVDLLRILLIRNESSSDTVTLEDDMIADEDDQRQTTSKPMTGSPPNQIGKCARRLMKSPDVVTQVFLPSMFQLLSVPDTNASHKMVEVVWPTMMTIGVVSNGSAQNSEIVIDETTARELFICVLRGLQVHGVHRDQHVARLLTLGVQMYEAFKPRYGSLRQVLLQATGRSEEEIQEFENRLWPVNSTSNSGNVRPLNEKGRRDLFKNFSQPLLGVALSERYREEKLLVTNLPESCQWQERARAARQAAASRSILDLNSEDAGLVLLFQE